MDLSQFKKKFVEEALGLINQLEESLLDLEENLDNKNNVQVIFRALHTLKGTSAMYGFVHIGDLVHDLESIFDLIREDRQEFTHSIFEITLKIVDHLRNLLNDEELKNETNQINQKKFLVEIASIVGEVKSTTHVPVEKLPEISDVHLKETFYIVFHPTESQLFRCINILSIFNELAGLGQYKIINHMFRDPGSDDSEQNAWGIYLVTSKGREAIEEVLMFVLDDCKILKVSNRNLFEHEEFIAYLDSVKNAADKNEAISMTDELEDAIESINKTEYPSMEQNVNKPVPEFSAEMRADIASAGSKNSNGNDAFVLRDVGKSVSSRINIDASKVDRLMYLVSELVITKSQLNLVVENKDYGKLVEIAEKIEDLTRNFRDNALNIRLVPVAEMIVPFKRLVRDLSKDLGKDVKFVTKGIETELDKNVIDRLSEPIMHIIRNSLDHGIETPEMRISKGKTPYGNIRFSSFYSGASVYIQIEDDGSGIDVEKVREKAIQKGIINADDKLKDKEVLEMIFHPGFSMADKVTEVSGRGVGMDVVRKKINELRGEVDVNSELGVGTTITIKLHQTLSIIDTLLIKVDQTHYLIPISDIVFCDQEKHDQLYKNLNRQVELEEELIPFISLRDLFNHGGNYPKKEKLVVVNRNDRKVAIVADKIVGEHQAVLKPLGEVFEAQQFLSGASFLGDGTLALMLDTGKLSNRELIARHFESNLISS